MGIIGLSLRRALLCAFAAATSAALLTGCSGVERVPDYRAADADSSQVLGAPGRVVLEPGEVLADLGAPVEGLVAIEGGALVLTGPTADGGPAVLWKALAGREPVRLAQYPVGAAYQEQVRRVGQAAWGWSLGAVPAAGPKALALGTGTRFGLVRDWDDPLAKGNYAGVLTTASPTSFAPVTGACGFDEGQYASQAMLSADGSDRIARRTGFDSLLGNEQGGTEVSMMTGPLLSVRADQREVAAPGPTKAARLTPRPVASVAGLRSLSCLSQDTVRALQRAGAPEALRDGTGNGVAAAVDRDLATAWFDRGRGVAGELVGQATDSGDDRLDGVLIDHGSGTAVAGLHLDVPGSIQVRALAFGGPGGSGYYALSGSGQVRAFSLG